MARAAPKLLRGAIQALHTPIEETCLLPSTLKHLIGKDTPHKWQTLHHNTFPFAGLLIFRARESVKYIDTFPLLYGNFYGGRLCHGFSEALPCRKRTRRRLGLRIISSKSKAEDASKPDIIEEEARQDQDSGTTFNRYDRNLSYGGVKYSVIRINNDGTWEPLILNTSELGVHARDLDLLAGNFFIPKRSAIAVRDDKVLLRMENVRALVCRDYCLLFDAHRPRKGFSKSPPQKLDADVVKQPVAEALHKAREAFAIFMAEHAKQPSLHSEEQMPFHLRMIECLLDETCNFFHQKVERLKLVVERILEELTNDVYMGGLQRLLPLKRALTEVEHDVRDTHEALDQVLGSDDMLDALCFEVEGQQCTSEGEVSSTSTKKEHQLNKVRQAAADMIVSYQREVDDAGGVLEELRKDMDSAQEVWELGLDTTRNRIITMNLYISIATVSLSLTTVPASFFGMNLLSGIENNPHMFYWVMGTTSALSLTCCFGLILSCRIWPNFKDKRRAQDLAALRDLLQHMDDIDEIFQSVASQGTNTRMTREEFEQILRSHSSSQFIRKRELDLIYRMFDGNRNGFLEAGEWNAFSQRRVRQKATQNFGRDL